METVSTEPAIIFGDMTLIPVVSRHLSTNSCVDINTSSYWLAAHKEPLFIIVIDSKGVRAFNMASSEITIDSLRLIISNIDTILERYH